MIIVWALGSFVNGVWPLNPEACGELKKKMLSENQETNADLQA